MRDEAEEQEPDQSSVQNDTSAPPHQHGVKGPRKKKAVDKKIDAVPVDNGAVTHVKAHKKDRQSSNEKDAIGKDGSSKERDEDEMPTDKESPKSSSNMDQEKKNDKSALRTSGDTEEGIEQHGGMTKNESGGLKEKKALQSHDKSGEEELTTIARKSGWNKSDDEEEEEEEEEEEHWSGCTCDKWESGSKSGKSKGSKSKGAKTKGSKSSDYHNKCIEWSCNRDIDIDSDNVKTNNHKSNISSDNVIQSIISSDDVKSDNRKSYITTDNVKPDNSK
ncbi:hypothetical protein ACHAW5_002220 [Stephanodiscus triporus]|uniref:Uncharacterized protein n=1 Tax=Stephanodiscus triporus TaxID=2934178 RepID=A0ABD3NTQ2_9STRA